MGKTRKEYDEDGVKLTMRTPDYLADMSGQMALGIMENLVGQMTYFYTDKVGMAVGAVGFHALVHLRVLQLLPGSDQSPDVLHLPELRPRGKTSRTPRGSRLPPYLTDGHIVERCERRAHLSNLARRLTSRLRCVPYCGRRGKRRVRQ